MDMSRIQHILDKAERDGTAMRTSGVVASAGTPAVRGPVEKPAPVPLDPLAAFGPAATGQGTASRVAPAASAAASTEEHAASYSVRLNPLLVAGLAPKSLAAEQYRSLRTRLAQAEASGALRTILVTSPQKGEGKSITAANLSLTMAQEPQRRVVILEADLRKPSLEHLFGLPPGPGLADYLAGAADLTEVMKFLPDHNLTVIPAGTAPTNPAELLGSTAMRRMLDYLRTRFDRVILDTPPVLPLADVAIVAPLVDGSVMVVRAGHTSKPAIENALRAFDSTRLLGIVLNESGMEQDYRYEAPKQ
jgi:capsular exopolysaccharide synthesis family protein